MIRIALFASGNGSNAENIARYLQDSPEMEIALILSNRKKAYVHERAAKLKIPSRTFSKEEWMDGERILEILRQDRIDFIVLAGFLLKVPARLLAAYPRRIINIHPALLPKYGGKGMYGDRVHQAVVEAGEKESGITIHFVNERYDEGAIIYQATCRVDPEDSPEQVAAHVHELEYMHFPRIVKEVALRETGRQGDRETGRRGDGETRRRGDRETERQGD